jgi:nitronate monooxygenase
MFLLRANCRSPNCGPVDIWSSPGRTIVTRVRFSRFHAVSIDHNQSTNLSHISRQMRLPLVAAPMTAVSTVEMVAAACALGVMGAFPTSNAPSAAALREWCDQISTQAAALARPEITRGPIAANLILHRSNTRLRSDIDSIVEARIPVVITSVGNPIEVIDDLRQGGCAVMVDVASVRHAHKAVDAGADGLVLLAAGAGGHTGWANPFAFVRAVRGFFDGPLAMAGGVADGAALWAARVAGYDLGFIGTRLIPTAESAADANWKQALVTAEMDDVELITATNGVVASSLRSRAGSGGHTVSLVDRQSTVADVIDEFAVGYQAARAQTEHLLQQS